MPHCELPSGPLVAACVDAVEVIGRQTGQLVTADSAARFASITMGRRVSDTAARSVLRWCIRHGLVQSKRGNGGGFRVVDGGGE